MNLSPLHDRGVIARYRAYLPVTEATPVVSLNEGSTPLIHSPKLSARVGRGCEVYVKYEGLNPDRLVQGSRHDAGRFQSGGRRRAGRHLRLHRQHLRGRRRLCGARRHHMRRAAAGGQDRVRQAVQAFMYGAKVVAIEGNFDDALRLVREIGETEPIAIVNSINPYRLQGQKTASFEIIEELGDAPEIHILPVGNAGNISAYWMGYQEFHAAGRATKLPKMLGFQAAGAAPIFHNRVFENPETVASAIRIGNPASWKLADDAIADSEGADRHRHRRGNPRRAALAGSQRRHLRRARQRRLHRGALQTLDSSEAAFPHARVSPRVRRIVCTVTGHGLKDPESPANNAAASSRRKPRRTRSVRLINL